MGSGSVVLHYARISSGAIVGAGAVVPGRMHVPSGALALGVPAVVTLGAARPDAISIAAAEYVKNGRRYRAELRRID